MKRPTLTYIACGVLALAIDGSYLTALADNDARAMKVVTAVARHLDDCSTSPVEDSRSEMPITHCRTIIAVYQEDGSDKYYVFEGVVPVGEKVLREGIPLTSTLDHGKKVAARVPNDCWLQQSKDGYYCRFITKSDPDYRQVAKAHFPTFFRGL